MHYENNAVNHRLNAHNSKHPSDANAIAAIDWCSHLLEGQRPWHRPKSKNGPIYKVRRTLEASGTNSKSLLEFPKKSWIKANGGNRTIMNINELYISIDNSQNCLWVFVIGAALGIPCGFSQNGYIDHRIKDSQNKQSTWTCSTPRHSRVFS